LKELLNSTPKIAILVAYGKNRLKWNKSRNSLTLTVIRKKDKQRSDKRLLKMNSRKKGSVMHSGGNEVSFIL
jgi:hypothetical protein